MGKAWKYYCSFDYFHLQRESWTVYPGMTPIPKPFRFLFPKQVDQFPFKIFPEFLLGTQPQAFMNSRFFSRESFQPPTEHIFFYTGGEALHPSCLPSGLPQSDRWVDQQRWVPPLILKFYPIHLSVLPGLSQDSAIQEILPAKTTRNWSAPLVSS